MKWFFSRDSRSLRIDRMILVICVTFAPLFGFRGAQAVEAGAANSSVAAKSHPYRVEVIRDQAEVFRDPHFDSEVIGQLSEGQKYFSSSKKFSETFYKILLGKNQFGYIADSDVKKLWDDPKQDQGTQENRDLKKEGKNEDPSDPQASDRAIKDKALAEKSLPSKKTKSKSGKKKDDASAQREGKKRKVFSNSNFVGVSYALVDYKENTMGDHRRDSLGFFGLKVSGPDLLVEGPMPTELNILFYPGAPSYYERVTGKSASGWILLMNGIWQNYYPLSREAFGIFGFGPLLKIAKYKLGLQDRTTGQTSYYSTDDFSLGMVFSAGAAVRLGALALRGEYSYYWEKEAYGGFNVSLQKDF